MRLEVAQLPHLLLADSALEDVGVHAACFLADVVFPDTESHDVSLGLDAVVLEDDRGPFGIDWASLL